MLPIRKTSQDCIVYVVCSTMHAAYVSSQAVRRTFICTSKLEEHRLCHQVKDGLQGMMCTVLALQGACTRACQAPT